MTNNKRIESLIYASLWLLAIVLFLLDIIRERSYTDLPLLDIGVIGGLAAKILPFLVLFTVNNHILIPRLLKRGRYGAYFMLATALIGIIWIWQRFQFLGFIAYYGVPEHPRHPGPDPILPLPLYLNVIYDLLIVGVNLAISLLFQHFEDRLRQEQLMKDNAENQLTYLKAQINPHFYMNMLNNIHGMIEIDAPKAQEMVLEMSALMRYMLYDSSRPRIELKSEVEFIRNYLNIMRVRYPEDTVEITAKFPETHETAGIMVPPLLLLVYIENAFKHGISYSGDSIVAINLSVNDGRIRFLCSNTIRETVSGSGREGIGLVNARQRMDIIYGDRYSLDIRSDGQTYTINLTLPYEVTDTDNR